MVGEVACWGPGIALPLRPAAAGQPTNGRCYWHGIRLHEIRPGSGRFKFRGPRAPTRADRARHGRCGAPCKRIFNESPSSPTCPLNAAVCRRKRVSASREVPMSRGVRCESCFYRCKAAHGTIKVGGQLFRISPIFAANRHSVSEIRLRETAAPFGNVLWRILVVITISSRDLGALVV